MSGKEADVYLVWAYERECVAKVYKEASKRSFKHRTDYTEGRRVRNSRRQRAMDKRSKYGKAEVEAEWRSAEVDAIYQLRDANVRVPEPYAFMESVLVMELVADAHGNPAPRLVDVSLHRDEAFDLFNHLLREVVKMLCAGLVHGDLSDFNVLLSADGPVIIDFPQAVDAAANRQARRLLVRDVDNLTSFLARYATNLRGQNYGAEMWDLFERGDLRPDTVLTGKVKKRVRQDVNTSALLEEIEAMDREVRERRKRLGLPPPRTRKSIPRAEPAPQRGDGRPQRGDGRPQRGDGRPQRGDGRPQRGDGRPQRAEAPVEGNVEGRRKRKRRRKKKKPGASTEQTQRPQQQAAPSRDVPDDFDSILIVE
jgi:RIO kinase 1